MCYPNIVTAYMCVSDDLSAHIALSGTLSILLLPAQFIRLVLIY